MSNDFDFDLEDGIPDIAPAASSLPVSINKEPLHLAILELIRSEPGITKAEIARRLGKSSATIGMIVSSDIFKERLAAMTNRWEAEIFESIDAQLQQTALEGLEKMRNLLRNEFDLAKVAPAVKVALGAMGLGAAKPGGQVVNNLSVNLPPEVFSRAQSRFGRPALSGEIVEE